VADSWPGTIKVMHADVLNFKQNLATGRDPGIVQVFQNLMLSVNGDAFSASEILKIDAVTAASEAQLDPMVDQAFGFHPLAHSHLGEQVNRSLLQQGLAETVFYIMAALTFNHAGLHTGH